jgi:hypothetical protein
MEELKKLDKRKVRTTVWNNILSVKNVVSNKTLTKLIDEYYKYEDSKAFLVRLNGKVNSFQQQVESGSKSTVQKPSKALTFKKLKEIKQEEKKMIEQGKI